MHATPHRTTGPFPDPDHDPVLQLRQIGGPVGLAIRFWPEPPADPSAFEVVQRDLTEPAATPVAASVLTFTAIITLTRSLASREEGGRLISVLPLPPGEDEALLPGPDHVEMFRVERATW